MCAPFMIRRAARNAPTIRHSDNRVYAVGQEATFTVKRAEQKIFLAVPHNISFYDTYGKKKKIPFS